MNDYISRQAAIDAIGKVPTYDDGMVFEALSHAQRDVALLPSAQQWIPCSERLPEEKGYYLTTTMYQTVYCDYWNGEHFDRTERVIAWMPLPEPYKEEE